MTIRRLAAALLLVLLGTACSSPDEPDLPADSSGSPSTGAGGNPSRAPESSTAQKLVQDLLEGEEILSPLATIQGDLALNNDQSPVTVDILAVRASPETTLLRWRLRSGGAERVRTFTMSLSASPSIANTSGVRLVDASGNQRLRPFTITPQTGGSDRGCVCSPTPANVGSTGLQLYALYPPLSPDATTVDVVIPGLPIAENVPVTR
jgi:hypothetical protein